MATKKELNTYFNLGEEWSVINARKLDFGTFFTLKMPGLSLYNLRVVPEGKKYPAFIGMPETKGQDGDYYKQYALYLSQEDTDAVIEAVEEELKKAKKAKK
jgi:DNA-binding cell septation regulator SpoVG